MSTETLHDSMFAYPALRKFPINTAEATESSIGAFGLRKDAFDKSAQDTIEANLKRAAEYFGIQYPLQKKQASLEEPLLFKGDSQNVSISQIHTTEDLEKATEYLIEKRASVPRADLAEAAKYVLYCAAHTDADMNSPKLRKIARIAGIGVGDREKIQYQLEKRATLNPFSPKDHEAFWKFAKESRELSDDAFFSEKNLNTICDVIDKTDFLFNNQYKHASDLGYPEDTVFEETLDDLIKEASDLYYVPSIDATMSKKATFERQKAINDYLSGVLSEYKALEGDELIKKVASLDKYTAKGLLEAVE